MYFEDFPGSTRKYWVFFIDSDLSQCNSWPQDTTGTPFASSPVGLRTRSNSVANFTSISPASPRGDMRSLPWFHFCQERKNGSKRPEPMGPTMSFSAFRESIRVRDPNMVDHFDNSWYFMIHPMGSNGIQWGFSQSPDTKGNPLRTPQVVSQSEIGCVGWISRKVVPGSWRLCMVDIYTNCFPRCV